MMDISFKWNRDFIIVVGDNGSGKTTLMQRLFVERTPMEKRFVLNSSRQSNWNDYVLEKHNYKPMEFTRKWFDKWLAAFVATHNNCLLVIDDYDNFNAKDSEVLKSVIINARHMNIGIILATRNLQSIPMILYQQAKYSFFGNQLVQYNRIYAGYFMGSYATQLNGIPKYSFLVFDGSQADFIKLKGVDG